MCIILRYVWYILENKKSTHKLTFDTALIRRDKGARTPRDQSKLSTERKVFRGRWLASIMSRS